jgi:hypothetical protein
MFCETEFFIVVKMSLLVFRVIVLCGLQIDTNIWRNIGLTASNFRAA